MLKLDDLRKKSAEVKAAVSQRKQPNQAVEQLRSDTLAETAYTPAAEERARKIPMNLGIPTDQGAMVMPTKMRNSGVLMDKAAGGQYSGATGKISINPRFSGWDKTWNKNMIRHELAHSMDANAQSSEQWDNAINGLGMMDSTRTPVNMLMNGSGLTDSMGMSKLMTKRGQEGLVRSLSENPSLYTPDEYTQDVEGFAGVAGGVTDMNAMEGSKFAKLFKSLYRKRK